MFFNRILCLSMILISCTLSFNQFAFADDAGKNEATCENPSCSGGEGKHSCMEKGKDGKRSCKHKMKGKKDHGTCNHDCSSGDSCGMKNHHGHEKDDKASKSEKKD